MASALPVGRADAERPVGQRPSTFPNGFLWGAGTSAYQIEGAVLEGGRGASIWDVFTHEPGRIANGDTGDVADDHYHRFRDDVSLMRGIGLKAYRFSVSWPRVVPRGTGQLNKSGIGFYDRLVDALLDAGIEPFCTLYHWDLPQDLQDRGGWEALDTAKAFADYAGHVARALGDRIGHFITLNEMRSFVDFGYRDGRYAPGLRLDRKRVAQARHHALLAHGLSLQAIKDYSPRRVQVGFAENVVAATPVVATEEHVAAAKRALREENAPFLTAIMEGAYTSFYLRSLGPDAPRVGAQDMGLISAPVDFVGLNVYQPTYIRADGSERGYAIVDPSPSFPRMRSEWLTVGPEVLYWAPLLVSQQWKIANLFITENGASCSDVPNAAGVVNDVDRIMFMRNYIGNLLDAVEAGAPVRGYFAWSLLDNFEWESGYGIRFGLIHVDFTTQERSMKLSALYYQEVVRRNANA